MKRWMHILVVLCLLLICTGCSKTVQESDEAGTYKIYYLNTATTKLTPVDYKTDTADTDLLVKELLEQFMTIPQDVDAQLALGDKVGYQKYKREDKVLYLYFDTNYGSMKPEREILCRAALAKTMTQIDGIDHISIYVGEQPLLDATGSLVGMLTASDFVESISDVNSFEKTELKLYFANETGDLLQPETREVVHNMNTSLEKLVVEQLMVGPYSEGHLPTLPKDIKLLNVSVNENVCYLNFDGAFLTNTLEVKDYIPIYSIVSSLSELPSVNKVQISVNGSQDVLFRDSISLNTLFERNLDYTGGQ